MKFKIQSRKIFDDGTTGNWKRWSSKVYDEIDHANQAELSLSNSNCLWGFDYSIAKMWKYEFRIIEHQTQPRIS